MKKTGFLKKKNKKKEKPILSIESSFQREAFMLIEYELTKLLNLPKSFSEILPDILKLIGEKLRWDFGAFWFWSDEDEDFRCVNIWAKRHEAHDSFETVTKLIRVKKGTGIIGQAAQTNKVIWIENVITYGAFLRKQLAKKNNLRTAFCFPVMRRDQVFGVFEFFSHGVRKKNQTVVQFAQVIGELMGRAIEREHTQEEIRLAYQKTEQLLSSIPSIIIGIDYLGRVIHFNQVAEKVLGRPVSEVLNKKLSECGFSWVKSHILVAIDVCRKQNKVVPLDDVPFEQANKNWGLLGFSLFPMSAKDGRNEVLMFGADITRKRQAEQDLRQARDLALQASRAKTDFLATMSHEIRTPMNAIIGMAELLYETPLNADQKEYVQVLKRGGDNLLNLINDILDLSKVESGLLELEETDFNIRDFLERSIEFMAVRAHQKGIELNCHVASDLPTTVIGDSNRLRQVVINLLGNAIKFTEKGEVSVNVRYAPDATHEDLSCDLLFEVKDTGIGIEKDKLDLIFEPFTQADSSTTRRYGGSGLGLSISKKLIGLMGGRIWVTSVMGQGTTFHFIIRLGMRKTGPKSIEEGAKSLQGIKALVVDDSAANRFILTETLQEWKMIVGEAVGGRECLEEIRRARDKGAPYQLLLLDCRMPGIGGFDVAKAIKEDPALSSMIVMMLTSDSRSGDVALSKKLHLNGYLIKPIKRADLLRVMIDSLDQAQSNVAVEPAKTSQPAMPTRVLNILAAEDAEDNRILLQSYLKNLPHRLTFAENGQVAVDTFKSQPFDLVFMDMHMPVMDGYQATQQIRQWEKEHPKERKTTRLCKDHRY
jgi:signal transduction histidine kinase/DNA-binding response OmpR family regulator/putative methionine-R-sulfoxide reductase with GAF domain